MEAKIVVTDLTKTFRLSKKQQRIERTTESVKVAVDHLSFEAYQGEIFGLLGPNGAGKTTTLRCISTLIKADSGDIYVDGHGVRNEETEIRKRIGFLTSDLKLEEFFTPNYLFDYFARLHSVDPETAAARKADLFGKFGIDRFAEVKVGELSTGMRQKVQIALALIHDPGGHRVRRTDERLGHPYRQSRYRLPARTAGRRKGHHHFHPHLQFGRENLRPRGNHRQRQAQMV